MSVEFALVLINTAGVLIIAIGMVATWKKNGRDQQTHDRLISDKLAVRDAKLESNSREIIRRLDDPEQGLSAINKAANAMRQHCARVSTELVTRMAVAEKDIGEIKYSRRRTDQK